MNDPATHASSLSDQETLLAGVADQATLARAAELIRPAAELVAAAPAPDSGVVLQPDELVGGRYRVVHQLSRGGMGIVYLASDATRGDQVALKVIRPDHGGSEQLLRFRHEYYLMSTLVHPRLVAVRDYVLTERGAPCLVMEYAPGSDLDDVLPLPWQDAAQVLYQVCSAVSFLHARGYIHHDIKPSNVRVERHDDGRLSARLVDFGIMEPIGSARERGFAGTPAYLPPEALFGAPTDRRLDLYSLGVLAFHMIVGRTPFSMRAPHTFLIEKQVAPPDVRAELGNVPPALADLIADLMAADAQRRPYDASVAMRRLRQATGLPLGSDATERAPAYLRPSRLIGRDELLDRLSELWSESSRQPRLVVLSAAAGYGKTALLHELRLRTRLSGGWTESASGGVHGGPYAVLRELLTRLVAIGRDKADAELAKQAPVLGRLLPHLAERFPEIGRAPPHADAGEDRRELVEAACAWLRQLLTEHRLALFVDDADLADAASLECLRALGSEPSLAGLMIVVALRSDRPSAPVARLVAGADQVLELGALAERDVAELVRSLFGAAEPYPKFVTALARAGHGNPSFVIEIIRRLVDQGLIAYKDERWQLPRDLDRLPLPATLEQAVAERLRNLQPLARRALELLVVARIELGVGSLVRLLSISERELASAIDQLTRAEAVEATPDGYRLARGVSRAEHYAAIEPDTRQRLELALGSEIERHFGADAARHAAILAEHFRRGGARDKALEYLVAASAELYDAHAHHDALAPLTHLEALLIDGGAEHAPSGSKPAELLLWTRHRLARVGVTVDTELAIRYFELERRALLPACAEPPVTDGRWPRPTRLAYLLGREAWRNRREPGRLKQLPSRLSGYFTATSYAAVMYALSGRFREALETAEGLSPFVLRARSQANGAYAICRSLAFTHQGRVAEAERVLKTAFHLLDDPSLRGGVLDFDYHSARGGVYTAQVLVHACRGRPEAKIWVERFREFVHAQDKTLRFLTPNLFLVLIQYHVHRGEIDEVAQIERAYKAHHARSGRYNAHVEAQILVGLARAALAIRDLAAAEALCHSLLQQPSAFSRGWAACVHGELWVRQRLYDRARQSLGEALAYATRADERSYKLELRTLNLLAELELDAGRTGDAQGLASRTLELARDPICVSEYEQTWALRTLARTALAQRDEPRAQRFARELNAVAEATGNPLMVTTALETARELRDMQKKSS